MRVILWSYLYPPSQEKLHAGLSHKEGRVGEMKWSKKKKERKERGRHKLKIGEETQGWLPVRLSSWAPVESQNVFVCMNTCHPVCSASLVNSNYGWMYRKVNNSNRGERGVKKQLLYIVQAITQQSTRNWYHQTIGIGYVQSHLCVAQNKGHRGQDFQMFPIIPQLWRDFPGHSTLRLSLLRIKKEGH